MPVELGVDSAGPPNNRVPAYGIAAFRLRASKRCDKTCDKPVEAFGRDVHMGSTVLRPSGKASRLTGGAGDGKNGDVDASRENDGKCESEKPDLSHRTKPSWFVIASNDRAISPEQEISTAKRMAATTLTLATSHVAMLAEPQKVADFMIEASESLNSATLHAAA